MAKELSDLTGVGSSTVETFSDMGIDSIQDLARADPDLIENYDVTMSKSRFEGFIEDAAAQSIIIQTGDEVVDEYKNITVQPTGIKELDDKIGGFQARSLVAVGGSTGAGKTQLAFQALGEAVKSSGEPAVYIETEPDRYRGNRIKQMFDENIQSQVHKISVSGEDALDMQYRAYAAVEENYDSVGMVVVDSFTSRFRLSTKFDGRQELGKRNQVFSKHLQKLETMSHDLDCPVLLMCQVYPSPTQYGTTDVIYGSSLMMHMVNYVIKMRSSGNALTNLKVQNHPDMSDFELSVQINNDGLCGVDDAE